MCTRKGYAASVSRLVPATAALYFPLLGTEAWAEKIRSQPQTIYSEVPLITLWQTRQSIFYGVQGICQGGAFPSLRQPVGRALTNALRTITIDGNYIMR